MGCVMTIVYAVRVSEFERGYGQRDELEYHSTKEDALARVNSINSVDKVSDRVPDVYYTAEYMGVTEI